MANIFSIAGQIMIVAAFAIFVKYVGSGQGEQKRATGLALIVLAGINVLTIWFYDVDPLQFTIKCMKGECPLGSKSTQPDLLQRKIEGGLKLEDQQVQRKELNAEQSPAAQPNSSERFRHPTEISSSQTLSTTVIATPAIDDTIFEMAIAPSGHFALVESYDSGSERLSVWDLRSGTQVRTIAYGQVDFGELGWSADERVVTALEAQRTSRPRMTAFHIDTGEERDLFSASTPISFVARDSEGDIDAIVYEGENYPSFISGGMPDKQITFRPPIWEPYEIDGFGFFVATSGLTQKREIAPQFRASQCAGVGHAYDAANMHLLWIGYGGCMLIWDLKAKKPHRIVENVPLEYTTVSEFSPGGKMFARGSRDGIVEIFSTSNWERIRKIRAEADSVSALSFGPDGRVVATAGGTDGMVKIWDVLTGDLKQSVEHTKGLTINHITILASGKRVISGSNSIKSSPLN